MKITKITKKEAIDTYDFEVEVNHHYFLDNGCASHNTSTGILMGATASWQPPHSKLNYQTLADISVPILPRYIKTRYWYYKGKFQYGSHDMIEVVERVQKWTDTGVSAEFNINPALTNIKLISDRILKGFKEKKLKAVYYSLTIDGKKDDGCTDCAN